MKITGGSVLQKACLALFEKLAAKGLNLNPHLHDACQILDTRNLVGTETNQLVIGFTEIIHDILASEIDLLSSDAITLVALLTICINLVKSYVTDPTGISNANITSLDTAHSALIRRINAVRKASRQGSVETYVW